MYKWSKVKAVTGAADLLRELSKTTNCYVATNAKASAETDIRQALARVGLDKYIKAVFCFRSTGFEKPSKEFFNNILVSLHSEKSEIVMVGDNLKKDIYGALDFGFDAIWFNKEQHQIPKGIKSVKHLIQIINL